MNKKIIYPAFFLMVLVQIYVPSRMIFHNEVVLVSGTAFKFKAAPVDPNDPFRGKYITLTFDENSFRTADTSLWDQGETIYVDLTTDSAGFAKVLDISRMEPKDREDYIKASVSYSFVDTMTEVFIQYPFDRFYMEESKAPDAEITYNESLRDTSQVTYALVMVKKGQAVVKNVLIDDVSIVDIVRERKKK
jgi:uncharacterized membrane-anchored protein